MAEETASARSAEQDQLPWSLASEIGKENPELRTLTRSKSEATTGSVAEQRDRKFQAFLARQEQNAKLKNLRRQQTEKMTQACHKPQINRKSLELMSDRADFYERLAKQSMKRERRKTQSQIARQHVRATFSPLSTITLSTL